MCFPSHHNDAEIIITRKNGTRYEHHFHPLIPPLKVSNMAIKTPFIILRC